MRAVIGFVGLQALFVCSGIALLRAFALHPMTLGRRALIGALGPALLAGAALVLPVLIVLLVLGIPLTPTTVVVVGLGSAGIAEALSRRRRRRAGPVDQSSAPRPERDQRALGSSAAVIWLTRAGLALAGAYVAFGAFALARLPTIGDDARIWSLKGLTLAYHHRLQPEIFQSPFQAGSHPVYPLFQPVLEAVLSQAMGHPELRLYHTELWLLLAAAAWTAGHAIARNAPRFSPAVWVSVLALLAVTPALFANIAQGEADITGSVLLATGALAFGLWLEREDGGYLALAAVLLAAAANTKDEDLVAAALVLVAGGGIALVRRRGGPDGVGGAQRPAWPLGAAAAYFVALVLPWRLWLSAHHLSDAVQPPLPQAVSPIYVLGRVHEFQATATAMLTQTLLQWGWFAPIFIAVCVVCLATRTARRIACFYLVAVGALVASLLWLYTTTPLNLPYLLATSMDRTVDIFVVPAALATAHMLATLINAPSPSGVLRESSVQAAASSKA